MILDEFSLYNGKKLYMQSRELVHILCLFIPRVWVCGFRLGTLRMSDGSFWKMENKDL